MSNFMNQQLPPAQNYPLPDGAFHHDFGALPTYEEANNPNGKLKYT